MTWIHHYRLTQNIFLISLLIASFHPHPNPVNHLFLFCLHNFAFTGFSWNIIVIIYRETFQIALFHLKYGFKIIPSLALLDISFIFINSAVSIPCVYHCSSFHYYMIQQLSSLVWKFMFTQKPAHFFYCCFIYNCKNFQDLL